MINVLFLVDRLVGILTNSKEIKHALTRWKRYGVSYYTTKAHTALSHPGYRPW